MMSLSRYCRNSAWYKYSLRARPFTTLNPGVGGTQIEPTHQFNYVHSLGTKLMWSVDQTLSLPLGVKGERSGSRD